MEAVQKQLDSQAKNDRICGTIMEIVRIYGKRWDIEVFFKMAKGNCSGPVVTKYGTLLFWMHCRESSPWSRMPCAGLNSPPNSSFNNS